VRNLGRALAETVPIALPGILGFALFVILSKPLSGQATPGDGAAALPAPCAGWHRGDGQSHAIDLARTEAGYREFKESLTQSLSKSLKDQTSKASPAGYDVGLRACRGGGLRRVNPARAVPESLRGRRLWFFDIPAGRLPRIPQEVVGDRDIVPLAAKVERFEDLGKMREVLGRPASLAPKGLGEALGVRCIPVLVTISKDGEVDIHEDP
jgi:hypothetical protein